MSIWLSQVNSLALTSVLYWKPPDATVRTAYGAVHLVTASFVQNFPTLIIKSLLGKCTLWQCEQIPQRDFYFHQN